MNALLKSLLGHLSTCFQPSTPTDSGVTEIATTEVPEILHFDEPRSAGDMLIECLRGHTPHRRLPDECSPGDAQRDADLYFAMTMAATRMI